MAIYLHQTITGSRLFRRAWKQLADYDIFKLWLVYDILNIILSHRRIISILNSAEFKMEKLLQTSLFYQNEKAKSL